MNLVLVNWQKTGYLECILSQMDGQIDKKKKESEKQNVLVGTRERVLERDGEIERVNNWTQWEIPLGNLISFGKFGPFVDNSPLQAHYYHHHHHTSPPLLSTQRPFSLTKHYRNATIQLPDHRNWLYVTTMLHIYYICI